MYTSVCIYLQIFHVHDKINYDRNNYFNTL